LAAIRTGDEEPSPEAQRTALRDVIGHCLYGVDVNPMAVELCKVSLWMEALEPGKPLSFLDHRILCGNSLLGATPAMLAAGVPDEAFQALEGDDRRVVSALRKQNRQEVMGQTTLFAGTPPSLHTAKLTKALEGLDKLSDDTLAGIHAKEQRYRDLARMPEHLRARLAADTWCAAFVCTKTPGTPVVTHDTYLRVSKDPASVPAALREEISSLAEDYRFLHWHVAFPDVFGIPVADVSGIDGGPGWTGGFDVVLGNPPWERIKLQEQEFFATRNPEIAKAPNAAARRRMIDRLAEDDPALHKEFRGARRRAEGESHLVRNSGRFPLCGRGDVNTYSIFAETKCLLVGPRGRVGTIVPTGIATDDTTKYFFQHIVEHHMLVSYFAFKNERFLFPRPVEHTVTFGLLTLDAKATPARVMEFCWNVWTVDEMKDPARRIELTADDIALFNPNTRTYPVFRTGRDAEIAKGIYRRVPVLIHEGPPEQNPWGVSFMTMFHMSNDSHLFCTRQELEASGWEQDGNVFHRGRDRYLPLYEAKMIHHFDHRWATYDGPETRDMRVDEKADPGSVCMPRYWVPESEVDARLGGSWEREWLLGWRDICRSTDVRTVIACLLPRLAVGNKIPLLFPNPSEPRLAACLLADQTSFVHDYASRQKMAGTTLNYFIYKQLPMLLPATHMACAPWSSSQALWEWVLPRVLELVYTSRQLDAFARDCGYGGPPFPWDEERRLRVRCELDAGFFHLYGVERDDVDYIMDTFHVVKQNDEARFGEYRTKRLVREEYDKML
jgi:hypothetical protein